MENKQPLNSNPAGAFETGPGQTDEAAPIALWLVEDDIGIREALAELLNTLPGIQCSRSFASAEGMLTALRQAPAPHLILSDLNLPGKSGIEAISFVRSLAPATPVLIVTTFYDSIQETAALKAGASGFLTKSCGVEDLVKMIRKACADSQPTEPHPETVDRPNKRLRSPRHEPAAVPWGARAFGILRAAMGLG